MSTMPRTDGSEAKAVSALAEEAWPNTASEEDYVHRAFRHWGWSTPQLGEAEDEEAELWAEGTMGDKEAGASGGRPSSSRGRRKKNSTLTH